MGSSQGEFSLTFPAQLRYLLQWFHEWSEYERTDFLPVFVSKFSTKSSLNGLIPSMENLNTSDERKRPPSLYQCRIKLFKDWTTNWSDNEKEQFIDSLKTIDEDFMKRFQEELSGNSGTKVVNGEHKELDVDLEDNII